MIALLNKSKLNAHATVFGHPSDLSRAELEQVAARTVPYTDFDFMGRYHLKNIQSRYPIAGTQLRIEKERELTLRAKYALHDRKAAEIRAQKMPSAARINQHQCQEKEAFERERDMSRLRWPPRVRVG